VVAAEQRRDVPVAVGRQRPRAIGRERAAHGDAELKALLLKALGE
jgi:hypothetical protein